MLRLVLVEAADKVHQLQIGSQPSPDVEGLLHLEVVEALLFVPEDTKSR